MIHAYMTVTRDDEEVEVCLTGQVERYGSANPHESGLGLADWYVETPEGFELTSDEQMRAEEALEREI